MGHARCLEKIGARTQARRVYLEFAQTYPHDFWATDALDRLKALGAEDESPRVVMTPSEVRATRRALAALNRGAFPEVLRLLAPVLAANKIDPWCRLRTATAALMVGDTSRAKTWFREAQELSPARPACG